MKVIDYHCVGASNPELLSIRVCQFVMKGWQPLGGVSASSSTSFGQAVVRYEKPRSPDVGKPADLAAGKAHSSNG